MTSDTDTAIFELEHAWMEAVRDRDISALERILAPEFTLTTGRPGAEVRARQEYLDITRDRYEIRSFAFEEITCLEYGDAAVVQSRYRQEGSMDGKNRTTSYRMTDVWIRREGRWQVVARHATAVQDR